MLKERTGTIFMNSDGGSWCGASSYSQVGCQDLNFSRSVARHAKQGSGYRNPSVMITGELVQDSEYQTIRLPSRMIATVRRYCHSLPRHYERNSLPAALSQCLLRDASGCSRFPTIASQFLTTYSIQPRAMLVRIRR